MGVAAKQTREPLGEGAPRAIGPPVGEAPDRQSQLDDLAACWQVGGPSLVAAMDCRTGGSTGRAPGTIALAFGGDAEGAGTVPCDMEKAATR